MGVTTTLFYRTCVKSHKLGKIYVKKGTMMTYTVMSLHHNEKYYEKPESFDISRFEKEKAKKI